MTAPPETPAGPAPAAAAVSEPANQYDRLDVVRAIDLARSLADRAEAALVGFTAAGADVPGDVVQALTDLPELARFVAATVTQTATDGRYTEAGQRDANAKVLADPVIRKLGNLAAQVVAAQAADDEQQAQQAKAARGALEPRSEFEKLRALEMAKAIRESGTNPGERSAFVNRGSPELKSGRCSSVRKSRGSMPSTSPFCGHGETPQDLRAAREAAHRGASPARSRAAAGARSAGARGRRQRCGQAGARAGDAAAGAGYEPRAADRVLPPAPAASGVVSRSRTKKERSMTTEFVANVPVADLPAMLAVLTVSVTLDGAS